MQKNEDLANQPASRWRSGLKSDGSFLPLYFHHFCSSKNYDRSLRCCTVEQLRTPLCNWAISLVLHSARTERKGQLYPNVLHLDTNSDFLSDVINSRFSSHLLNGIFQSDVFFLLFLTSLKIIIPLFDSFTSSHVLINKVIIGACQTGNRRHFSQIDPNKLDASLPIAARSMNDS